MKFKKVAIDRKTAMRGHVDAFVTEDNSENIVVFKEPYGLHYLRIIDLKEKEIKLQLPLGRENSERFSAENLDLINKLLYIAEHNPEKHLWEVLRQGPGDHQYYYEDIIFRASLEEAIMNVVLNAKNKPMPVTTLEPKPKKEKKHNGSKVAPSVEKIEPVVVDLPVSASNAVLPKEEIIESIAVPSQDIVQFHEQEPPRRRTPVPAPKVEPVVEEEEEDIPPPLRRREVTYDYFIGLLERQKAQAPARFDYAKIPYDIKIEVSIPTTDIKRTSIGKSAAGALYITRLGRYFRMHPQEAKDLNWVLVTHSEEEGQRKVFLCFNFEQHKIDYPKLISTWPKTKTNSPLYTLTKVEFSKSLIEESGQRHTNIKGSKTVFEFDIVPIDIQGYARKDVFSLAALFEVVSVRKKYYADGILPKEEFDEEDESSGEEGHIPVTGEE